MCRIFGWIMVILLCVPNGARAECVLANALSQVHMLQVDLAKTPDNPLAGNVLQYIAGQMQHLQDDDLARISEIHPADDADVVFANFAFHTQQLLQAYRRSGGAALGQHFDQDQVRRNLRLTGQYLVTFGCLSRATGGQPGQTVFSQQPREAATDSVSVQENGETPFDRIKRYLATPTGAATGLFAIAGAVAVALLIRGWMKLRRRRARRYDCHYATQFRVAGRHHEAVILDVSGMGIKLRHSSDKPVEIGTQIEVCIFDEWHMGTVAWGNAHYFGILFRQALSRQDVRHLHKGQHEPVALAA